MRIGKIRIRVWIRDLEFPQNDGKISFRAVYGNCSIADLGPGKVEDFLGVDPTSAKFSDPRNVVPQSGHVYLLDHEKSLGAVPARVR